MRVSNYRNATWLGNIHNRKIEHWLNDSRVATERLLKVWPMRSSEAGKHWPQRLVSAPQPSTGRIYFWCHHSNIYCVLASMFISPFNPSTRPSPGSTITIHLAHLHIVGSRCTKMIATLSETRSAPQNFMIILLPSPSCPGGKRVKHARSTSRNFLIILILSPSRYGSTSYATS